MKYLSLIFQSLHGHRDGYDMQDLVLLQTILGLCLAIGMVSSGTSINKQCQIADKKFIVSRQYICQVSNNI